VSAASWSQFLSLWKVSRVVVGIRRIPWAADGFEREPIGRVFPYETGLAEVSAAEHRVHDSS